MHFKCKWIHQSTYGMVAFTDLFILLTDHQCQTQQLYAMRSSKLFKPEAQGLVYQAQICAQRRHSRYLSSLADFLIKM